MTKKLILLMALGFVVSACEPCYVSMGGNTGRIATGACDSESGILPQFNPFSDASGSITSN